ncbi:polyprenyl synthetase family protein [Thermodesulfobacteriota bacterium]
MDPDSRISERYKEYFDNINEEMKRNLKSRVPLIEEIGNHTLLGGGKRLRPLFFVLCCRLCGYQGEDVYTLSTIFEYVHAASLLHDDVLDNADVRRKKPSANNVWGNNAAVLEGDFLFSSSLSVALRAKSLEFLNILSKASLRMTEGQVMELVHTDDWSLRKEKYLEIIEAKTAALISVACASGAIISGVDEEKGKALADFGTHVGIAFQLMDDLLDYSSSEEVLGKPVGKDLREGKITLPHILVLPLLDADKRKKYKKIFTERKAGEKDYKAFINFVRERKILDKVHSEAKSYVKRAYDDLRIFHDSRYKEDLLHLSEYIVNRKY